jgi:hypothetical protein
MKDFAKVYRRCSNDELARQYYDVASLTEPARSALGVEIHQRGLTPHALAALSKQRSRYSPTSDNESQEQRAESKKPFGRRMAIRIAMLVVGSLLVLGLALLSTGNQARNHQSPSNSQR